MSNENDDAPLRGGFEVSLPERASKRDSEKRRVNAHCEGFTG